MSITYTFSELARALAKYLSTFTPISYEQIIAYVHKSYMRRPERIEYIPDDQKLQRGIKGLFSTGNLIYFGLHEYSPV